jgi:uncharacterized membrane protein
MSVDEAMKMIISGGTISPPDRKPLAETAQNVTPEKISR